MDDEKGGGRPQAEEEPEERTDGWMTSYADMVTLLMTFFVLMWALSSSDDQKIMLFFAGLSSEGLSLERFEEINAMFSTPDDASGDYPILPELDNEEEAPTEDDEIESIYEEQLAALYREISRYIQDNNLGDSIAIQRDGDFIVITLPGDIAFPSASATITEDMQIIAGELSRLIARQTSIQAPFEIVVTGHTDNVPIHTVTFRSNWHLSAMRAMNFLEVLLYESDMNPRYFSARGYGEERPIDDNNTETGRARNRRVEVMITPLREVYDDRVEIYHAPDPNAIPVE